MKLMPGILNDGEYEKLKTSKTLMTVILRSFMDLRILIITGENAAPSNLSPTLKLRH
jgi:hypothetical protein